MMHDSLTIGRGQKGVAMILLAKDKIDIKFSNKQLLDRLKEGGVPSVPSKYYH